MSDERDCLGMDLADGEDRTGSREVDRVRFVYTDAIRARIIQERGYLVLGSHFEYKPGAVVGFICDAHPQRRMAVLAETDQRDHEEQCRLVGDLPYNPENPWPRFYRLTTD
jgi:hypothetical protein